MAGNRRVILLIESSRASGQALLSGIAAYARHHGPWSFFWKASGFEKTSAHILELEADGIITRDFELKDEFLARGLPALVVGHSRGELDGVANVVTDSKAAGRMAADHLLGCGFKRFAFCGYLDRSWSDLRLQAFSKRLAERGFATQHFSVRAETTGRPWKGERRSISPWLRTLPKPLGLLACNDDLGHEVIEACKLEQLSVPDDIGVIGVEYGFGTYARLTLDSATQQSTQPDQDDGNLWLLILRRDGTNFSFYKRSAPTDPWRPIPNKTVYQQEEFAGAPMQVGVMAGPWWWGAGVNRNVLFDHFMLDATTGSPLQISLSATDVVISWPATPRTLQSSPSLASPNWQPAGGQQVFSNSLYSVVRPISPGATFYRLVQ